MLKWYSTGLSDINRRSWVPFTHTSQDKSRQTSCSLDATILFLGYAIAVRPITTVVIGPADATPAYQWPPYHSIISIQHINPISIVLNLCQKSLCCWATNQGYKVMYSIACWLKPSFVLTPFCLRWLNLVK